MINDSRDKKIASRFVGWFFLFNTFLFWIFGSIYLKNILLSDTLFNNSWINYSTIFDKTFVLFFTLCNYFSYLMLLAFIPAVVVVLVSLFIPNIRFIRILSVFVAILCLLLLACDSLTYLLYKFHLSSTVLGLILRGQWYELFDFSIYETIIFFVIFCFICIAEVIIAWFVWDKIIVGKRWFIGRTIGVFWLGGFLISYITLFLSMMQGNNLFNQQAANLPLYNQLISYLMPGKNAEEYLYRYSEEHYAQPIFSKKQLQYPLHPMECTKPEKPLNIIFIMVDSLRFDGLQYMPEVTQFGKANWQFINHYSGGNATQPGLFSLFYSLPHNYWTAALEYNIAPVFIQLLLKYHYTIEAFWSNGLLNPAFNKTIFGRVPNLKSAGAPGYDIGNKDRYITQKAIEFLANQKQPFFLSLFYDAPHGYCREQSYPTLYQPTLTRCMRIMLENSEDPLPLYNRYLNSVHFVDEEIGKLLKAIEQNGYLNNSIVVITSDHGQEFNDHKQNYWGHASNFTSTQVQVPLMIHIPGQKPQIIQHRTSHYDVVPTLLQQMYQCKNPIADYSIGQNLFIDRDRLPFILVASYINMGLIEHDRLTTLRTSGNIAITDLQARAILKAKLRINHFKKALKLMRMYYVG